MNSVLRRAERLGSIFMHVQLRPKAPIYSVNVARRSALAQDRLFASAYNVAVADRVYIDERNALQN